MVYAPDGVIHSMGNNKNLTPEERHFRDQPTGAVIPGYARIEFPLVANDATLRRMADDLHGLANQIAFSATRFDLHITRRLTLIHAEISGLNLRWRRETGRGGKSTDKSWNSD